MITFNREKAFTMFHLLNASNVLKHLTCSGYTSLGPFSGCPNIMDSLSIITIIKTNKVKRYLKSNKIEKIHSFKIKKQVFKKQMFVSFLQSHTYKLLTRFTVLR